MTQAPHPAWLARAFVRLADTLVAGYDTVDLLTALVDYCTDLADIHAAGLLLSDARGRLSLVASTSEQADFVETLQLNANAGPCMQCFHTGRVVAVPDIHAADADWADFTAAALLQGFRSVLAVPLRLRRETIGTMNLFRTHAGPFDPSDTEIIQALADVATISIMQERAIHERGVVADQLQRALDSRILIEQAKGVLAEAGDMTMDAAFATLRRYARSHNQPLHAVAEAVTTRTLDILHSPAPEPRG